MLALVFGGRVVFVKSHEDDARATEELKTRKVIGLDCEWVPDFKPGSDSPLSIVQVCDGDSCYLWLLYQFRGTPKGLHSIITDESITKVGCGMRGSDLNKFARSKLAVGPGRAVGKSAKLQYDLPAHFEDIQDYKIGANKDERAPYLGLDHLGALYLQRRPPVTVKSTSAKWHFIEKRSKTLYYAVTDAYAAFLIYLTYHENLDQVAALLARDDDSMREFVSDHLNEDIPANQRTAKAIKAVGPFRFDSSPSNPLSEADQRQLHLHRQFFAARVVVEAEELRQNPNTENGVAGRSGPQGAPRVGPNHQNRQQQPRQRQQRQNNGPQHTHPNAQNQHSNQNRQVQRRGSFNGGNSNNGRQMPAVPPPPSRQASSVPSATETDNRMQVDESVAPTSNGAPQRQQQSQSSQPSQQQRQQRRPNNGNGQNRGPRPQQHQGQPRRPSNPPKSNDAPPANGASAESAHGALPQAQQDASKNGGQKSARPQSNGRNHNNKPKVDGNEGSEGRRPQQQRRQGDNNKQQRNGGGRAPATQAPVASSSSAPN